MGHYSINVEKHCSVEGAETKKHYFSRKIDVYVDMGYSELGGHSKISTCWSGTLKYKSWETLFCKGAESGEELRPQSNICQFINNYPTLFNLHCKTFFLILLVCMWTNA